MPARSRRVAVLAHCHLDANTKVHGLADYAGARDDLVVPLIERGVGIVQLPCPEATFLGMRRWGMTREQYDTPAYRRHCRAILGSVVDTLAALAEDGCVIEMVVGVDGSPSCGIALTPVGYEGGEISRLAEPPADTLAPGRGVFMEVLGDLLAEAGLDIPFEGMEERPA
jgi:predicted secreted protein